MYLANAPVLGNGTRSDINTINALSTTGLFIQYFYSVTFAKCILGHRDRVPTARVFGHTGTDWTRHLLAYQVQSLVGTQQQVLTG